MGDLLRTAPLLVGMLVSNGCADDPYPATGELSLEDFDSVVVGDAYKLRVRLPPGYDEAASPIGESEQATI